MKNGVESQSNLLLHVLTCMILCISGSLFDGLYLVITVTL